MKVFKMEPRGHLVEILERGCKYQLLLLLFSGPVMSDSSCQASLSLTISQSLLKFMSIALVMLSSHLILWCPFLLLPSIFPSIRVFSNELAVHIRWPKYWSFSFSNSPPMSEYSGLISLRTDWLDLLAVKGTLKSLLQAPQFKSISSSVLCILYCPGLTTKHDYWKYYWLS